MRQVWGGQVGSALKTSLGTALRAVGRWLSPVTSVITPLGWLSLVLGSVALVCGRHYHWAELSVAGVVGLALVVCAVPFVVGRSHYDIDIDLARRRVQVGDRAFGELHVRNASTRALLPSQIDLPVGNGVASFPLPRLAAGALHDEMFVVPTGRRAVINVGPVRSSRGDSLGLLRREVTWTHRYELFVHPITVNLDGASAGFLRDLEGQPTEELSSSDVSFHTLRDYTPGDDMRHIHWKTTARTGKLMVRQFEETRRSHLLVALSTDITDYGRDEQELELAVSVATSLGIQAIKEHKDVTVMASQATLRTLSGPGLLDDSCRLGLAATSLPLLELSKVATAAVPDASVGVLVFGSVVEPAAMRRAAAELPLETIKVAVRLVPGAGLRRRAVADLTIFDLGDLNDLPRAMRRVGTS